MDIFCERYKELKKEKGVTHQQIADYMGLQTRTVQYYTSGKLKPDYYGLLKLADFFEVSLDYLTGRTNKR